MHTLPSRPEVAVEVINVVADVLMIMVLVVTDTSAIDQLIQN